MGDDSYKEFKNQLAASTARLAEAVEMREKKRRTKPPSWGPLYTMVFWPVLEEFDLKHTDYLLADAIEKLSGNHGPVPGWCNASKPTLARLTRVSERTVFNSLKTLKNLELVEHNEARQDLLRTTAKWDRAVELCRRRLH